MSLDTMLAPVSTEVPQVDMLEEIANYVFTSKYARYRPEDQRRETWEEAVDRVADMHLDRFNHLTSAELAEIEWAFHMVQQKRVVPSMRSMQFGGPAVLKNNERIFNCAVRHIDSLRSFAEVFYLLLCGCGVGLGLTDHFLDRLPNLVGPEDRTGTILTYVVEDSIEGWADSIEALLSCYFINTPYSGRSIVFDYSRIRPEGAPIKSGGLAPGYRGLKRTMQLIKKHLDDAIEQKGQSRLKTIDAYDILMHLADAVLSGGVRRSATSVIFDPTDEDMLNAKTGNWFEENPQRARSNNSVLLLRDQISLEEFGRIANRTKEWGEPGFVFADHPHTLFNPCFEIAFIPVTDDGVCGVQMCNLTSVNGGKVESEQDFYDAVRAATIIGTLQASYTEFPYLGRTSEQLTRDEALLGVSVTAMMESPDVILNPDVQRVAAAMAVTTNAVWAGRIGIDPAARITCIKPEGTSTLALESMASGIHPAHAHKMIRRIQANRFDPVYKHFKATNPHLCEPSVWSANGTDDVISFPVDLKPQTMVKGDLEPLDHLEIILQTQKNWVIPGTTPANRKPLNHNVSCTVEVGDGQWTLVFAYLYNNREGFAAVSLIPKAGDTMYQQAPNQAMVSTEDIKHHHGLLVNSQKVDYTQLREFDDATSLMETVACGGGACEIV